MGVFLEVRGLFTANPEGPKPILDLSKGAIEPIQDVQGPIMSNPGIQSPILGISKGGQRSSYNLSFVSQTFDSFYYFVSTVLSHFYSKSQSTFCSVSLHCFEELSNHMHHASKKVVSELRKSRLI